jgi:hypothetical protein
MQGFYSVHSDTHFLFLNSKAENAWLSLCSPFLPIVSLKKLKEFSFFNFGNINTAGIKIAFL